jgi:hypothetical protein
MICATYVMVPMEVKSDDLVSVKTFKASHHGRCNARMLSMSWLHIRGGFQLIFGACPLGQTQYR